MQEAYFQARDRKLRDELGVPKPEVVTEKKPEEEPEQKDKPKVEENKSKGKMAFIQMLQDDNLEKKSGNTRTRLMSRAKSGYIIYNPTNTLAVEKEPEIVANPVKYPTVEIDSRAKEIMSKIIELKSFTQEQMQAHPERKDEISVKFTGVLKQIESKIKLSKNIVVHH